MLNPSPVIISTPFFHSGKKAGGSFPRFLIFLLWVFMHATTFAQTGNLSGMVTDDKGAPVPFANVTLIKLQDSAFITASLTDSSGKYTLASPAEGAYLIRFSAIGFTEAKTNRFEVTGAGFVKDFGVTSLKQDVKTLKNVTITALRPTITQLADRMVVNIEGTALAAGSTAYAVLSKAPGVFIDAEGNIQLNGRSGVTVMLDGKLTYLSARDLRMLLEGMSAENIKSIEIITNPSAKYDAEGTSGMLNINLKKNTLKGINGSVYSSYSYNFAHHAYAGGGNLNYKSGKWNSFLNVDAARRVGGREATFTRVFYDTSKTTYFDQVATGRFSVQGPPAVRMGTDYAFNDRNSIGAMVYYIQNTAEQEFLTETYIGNAPKSASQFIEADNYGRNTFSNFTTNLHYTGKPDTTGTSLSADLDYVRITNRGDAHFYNYFNDLSNGRQSQDILYNNTPNGYYIYSGKIDFTRPLNKDHKMEIGVKASRVASDNDFRFYFKNGALALDPLRSNHFKYSERIYAAYLNWTGKISDRVNMQAGLRAEETKSRGESLSTRQVNSRKYLNLFPSVFLQQKVRENYGINYSYSRRLTRPNYGNLNPFKSYRDPYTWIEGNPYLRPQYTHSFSITQTFKKLYNLTASYQLNKDVMAEIPILDVVNATTIYTTGNVDDGYSISLTGIAPLKILKKWDTQNTILLSYNKFSMMSNNGPLVNDQLFFMLQSNHTILLPLQLHMELNLLYRGPAASGLYHMAAMHRVNVAFKRTFINKKLELAVNGNDIFKGFRFFWTTDINGNVNEFDQYLRFRTVGLSLRYNFSKGQKVDTRRRANSVDEINRI